MSKHVYANAQSIASKIDDGKSIAAFPDVCFSPPSPPAGPMPLPYPNTSEATDTDKGTAKVFIGDKMVGMGGDSTFSKSMGDEAATQSFNKGLISGDLTGLCQFVLGSMDVQVEGKSAVRNGDPMMHNGDKPGNGALAPYTSGANPPPAAQAPDAEQPWITLIITKAVWDDTDRIKVRRCGTNCGRIHYTRQNNFLEGCPGGLHEPRPYTTGFTRRPGVFLSRSASSHPLLDLTFEVVSNKVPIGTAIDITTTIENATLSGTYTHEGDGKGKKAEIFLRSPLQNNQFLRCALRGVRWKLENLPADFAAGSGVTGVTSQEIYFVFDEYDPTAYKNNRNIHLEALRVAWLACTHPVYGAKDHSNITDMEEVVASVTRYLFHAYGWTYDTVQGAGTYFRKTGGFCLVAYLTKKITLANRKQPENANIVNCVTQGCAVRFVCHAAGITVETIQEIHFGYLKVLDLIGPENTSCNNPFYKNNNYKYNDRDTPKLIKNVIVPFTINPYSKSIHIEDVFGTWIRSKGMTRTSDMFTMFAEVYARKIATDHADYGQIRETIVGYMSNFYMHFFNEFNTKIYDACGGPVDGKHDLDGYHKTVINDTLNKYTNTITDVPSYMNRVVQIVD